MNTELTILRPENVQLIAQNAPQIFQDNKRRSENCLKFGQALLAQAQTSAMNDELDQQFAVYLEKTRKTIKLMNEQRAPITKLFDQIRTEFTSMENSIDVSKAGSVPADIQKLRNAYATQKRAEEEQRRRAELVKQQKQLALSKYEQDVEDDYRRQFTQHTDGVINHLSQLNATLTLDNFEAQSKLIASTETTIPANLFTLIPSKALRPQLLTGEEATEILQRVQARLLNQFNEQYAWEVGDYKNSLTDALPAKRRELEAIAKASAEEQERLKAELAAKEAAEASRLEEERKRKAEEEEAAKKMQAEAQEMGALFATASVATPTYQPKTSVKKRVVPLDAEGIINIVSFWWSKNGQFMELEELKKMFKKQITAVEKYANDKSAPEFIKSEHVIYEDEVKAK